MSVTTKDRSSASEQAAASALVEALESVESPIVRVKRKYTVTPDRPKNKPNTSDLIVRQVSNANRITGTMTSVVDLANVTEQGDLEDFAAAPTDGSEDRWLVACHDHSFSTTIHTLLEARRAAFIPPLWCPECALDVPLTDEFDEYDGEPIVRAPYAESH